MKRSIYTLCFALLASFASYGDVIQYDTNTGSQFNCSGGNVTGCGTQQITIGGTMTLTYLPTTGTSVSVDPYVDPTTFSNFGYLQFACVDGTTTCDPNGLQLPSGLSLIIQVNQATPDSLDGTIPNGLLQGSISGSSSGAYIQWAPGASVVLQGAVDQVKYSILNPILGLTPPASCQGAGNCGETTIQSEITELVPEPAVSLLMASGLVAIGTIRRRK
jgi:hypothetical protein